MGYVERCNGGETINNYEKRFSEAGTDCNKQANKLRRGSIQETRASVEEPGRVLHEPRLTQFLKKS